MASVHKFIEVLLVAFIDTQYTLLVRHEQVAYMDAHLRS